MAIQTKQFKIPDIPNFDLYEGDVITKNLSLNIDVPLHAIQSLKLTMKINVIDTAMKGSIEFQFGNTNVESLTIQTTGNVVKDYTKNVELADIQPNYPIKAIAHNLRWSVVAVSITNITGEVTYTEALPETNSSINIGNVAVDNIYSGLAKISKVYIGDIVVYSKVVNLKPVLAWEFTGHTNTVNSVAADTQSNVYTSSYDNAIRKISSEGSEVWKFTEGIDQATSVAVDTQGNVYVGSYDQTVRKISGEGTEVWKFTGNTGWVNSVAVDKKGNVYSGSYDKVVRKISSEGTEIWAFRGHGGSVNSVAVDSENNIYTSGADSTIIKISNEGNQLWVFSGAGYVYSIAVDNSGNVYVGNGDKKVMKIKQEGE